MPVMNTSTERYEEQDDYDIDKVVEAVTKAMAVAARNYYLPDKPENSKAIARYAKDSKKVIFSDTTFKRELAQICMDLSGAAGNAANATAQMLPGRPLRLPSETAALDEGVSSMTITYEGGEVAMVYTNTLPCINATGATLHGATLEQYPRTAADAAARSAYGQELSSILTANRLFNHALSEVCARLVQTAKRTAEAEKKTKSRKE